MSVVFACFRHLFDLLRRKAQNQAIRHTALTSELAQSNLSRVVALLQADYGPFQPNRTTEVPLWLAMALHKRKKCRIQPPAWMEIEHLKGAAALRWLSDLPAQLQRLTTTAASKTFRSLPLTARGQICKL